MKSKPSWSSTFLEVAGVMAKRSMCASRRVGAVIADTSNRIVATGFNGPSSRMVTEGTCANWCLRQQLDERTPTYEKCPSIHAEMNALMYSDRSLRLGGTLYVTHTPCADCTKAISNSGLAAVVSPVGPTERELDAALWSRDFLEPLGIEVEYIGLDVAIQRWRSIPKKKDVGYGTTLPSGVKGVLAEVEAAAQADAVSELFTAQARHRQADDLRIIGYVADGFRTKDIAFPTDLE